MAKRSPLSWVERLKRISPYITYSPNAQNLTPWQKEKIRQDERYLYGYRTKEGRYEPGILRYQNSQIFTTKTVKANRKTQRIKKTNINRIRKLQKAANVKNANRYNFVLIKGFGNNAKITVDKQGILKAIMPAYNKGGVTRKRMVKFIVPFVKEFKLSDQAQVIAQNYIKKYPKAHKEYRLSFGVMYDGVETSKHYVDPDWLEDFVNDYENNPEYDNENIQGIVVVLTPK